MPAEYAQCLENLKALIEKMDDAGKSHRNEATTRLQFIDGLLFDCLGWDKSECVAEDNFEGTYADYSLGTPHKHLIVEAKKEDIYFEVPAGVNDLTFRIQRFKEDAPDVYKAIKQAMGYCQSRGVPFGAVCNGHQLVAFLASRTDGIPPIEGRALVFGSPQHMVEHFLELWNCLSRAGVTSRGLPVLLQETGERPPPDKLSLRIPKYPRFQMRNSLQTKLQVFGDLIIEDVGKLPENQEGFLKECYASSGALSQYALISKSILQSKYSTEFEESLAGPSLTSATAKGGNPTITTEMLAQSATKRPVLLIGDVGVGKTMFVRHFISIDAAELLREAIILYIDLGVQPTLDSELDKYLESEISRQLREDYSIDIEDRRFVQGVYNMDLSRFKKGIYGGLRYTNPAEYEKRRISFLEDKLAARNEHLRLCLEHIQKGRNQQILTFLDNVDQRSDDFQQRAFLIGQSMAELWPAFVFVSLRPETFHRSRSGGTLSAYHAKAFTISPPRVDRVIQKRIRYAMGLLESGDIGRTLVGVEIHVDLQDLLDYLRIIDYSFNHNGELVEFVDNVCGGNIRLALDFIQTFVGSGHANTAKMLQIYRETGRYSVAFHEFVRAVIYGDYRDYNPGFSKITNLFDISGADGREHFLAPIALGYLGLESQASGSAGYVAAEAIYGYVQHLGFQPAKISGALDRLLSNKLIETETKRPLSSVDEGRDLYYRITTIGSYYYRKLVGIFTYVDAMVVDTPIVDRTVRERIGDETTILGRLDRAEEFRRYLDSQWTSIEAAAEVFNWQQLSSQLNAEISSIKNRLQMAGQRVGTVDER